MYIYKYVLYTYLYIYTYAYIQYRDKFVYMNVYIFCFSLTFLITLVLYACECVCVYGWFVKSKKKLYFYIVADHQFCLSLIFFITLVNKPTDTLFLVCRVRSHIRDVKLLFSDDPQDSSKGRYTASFTLAYILILNALSHPLNLRHDRVVEEGVSFLQVK